MYVTVVRSFSETHPLAAFGPFANWSDMASARRAGMSRAAVAPTLDCFAPENVRVPAYQWGASPFVYRTSGT
ncbi:hypothetical protein GCM10010345_01450 [Streptomyces canarius]|uniref:non-reducing end alpha-L-arabinofuranosidase n=1 Tax=Streptomyces canarius TaxID=285453 RepID=A0ABQ3CCQ4_9ACTN|nr:hypothetical protein GCM10010345_01450 [Streptomyces canarius]